MSAGGLQTAEKPESVLDGQMKRLFEVTEMVDGEWSSVERKLKPVMLNVPEPPREETKAIDEPMSQVADSIRTINRRLEVIAIRIMAAGKRVEI